MRSPVTAVAQSFPSSLAFPSSFPFPLLLPYPCISSLCSHYFLFSDGTKHRWSRSGAKRQSPWRRHPHLTWLPWTSPPGALLPSALCAPTPLLLPRHLLTLRATSYSPCAAAPLLATALPQLALASVHRSRRPALLYACPSLLAVAPSHRCHPTLLHTQLAMPARPDLPMLHRLLVNPIFPLRGGGRPHCMETQRDRGRMLICIWRPLQPKMHSGFAFSIGVCFLPPKQYAQGILAMGHVMHILLEIV